MSTAPKDDQGMWERLTRWWEGPDHNPRSMDPDLLEWVLTWHPKMIKMQVNQEALNRRVAELEAQGVEITPDMFPGLTMYKKVRPEGFNPEADSSAN